MVVLSLSLESVGALSGALAVLGGANAWVVNRIIDNRLSTFLREISDQYVHSNGSDLTGAEIERALDRQERKLDDLNREGCCLVPKPLTRLS